MPVIRSAKYVEKGLTLVLPPSCDVMHSSIDLSCCLSSSAGASVDDSGGESSVGDMMTSGLAGVCPLSSSAEAPVADGGDTTYI